MEGARVARRPGSGFYCSSLWRQLTHGSQENHSLCSGGAQWPPTKLYPLRLHHITLPAHGHASNTGTLEGQIPSKAAHLFLTTFLSPLSRGHLLSNMISLIVWHVSGNVTLFIHCAGQVRAFYFGGLCSHLIQGTFLILFILLTISISHSLYVEPLVF